LVIREETSGRTSGGGRVRGKGACYKGLQKKGLDMRLEITGKRRKNGNLRGIHFIEKSIGEIRMVGVGLVTQSLEKMASIQPIW